VTTHVALVDLPGLLADVVLDAFANESDVDVEVLPAGSLPANILAGHPDVVMACDAGQPNSPFARELLRQHPSLGLFTISPDGRRAWVHELSVHSRPLAEVSGASLREAVRAITKRISDEPG
jgi:hypothetical protein